MILKKNYGYDKLEAPKCLNYSSGSFVCLSRATTPVRSNPTTSTTENLCRPYKVIFHLSRAITLTRSHPTTLTLKDLGSS